MWGSISPECSRMVGGGMLRGDMGGVRLSTMCACGWMWRGGVKRRSSSVRGGGLLLPVRVVRVIVLGVVAHVGVVGVVLFR